MRKICTRILCVVCVFLIALFSCGDSGYQMPSRDWAPLGTPGIEAIGFHPYWGGIYTFSGWFVVDLNHYYGLVFTHGQPDKNGRMQRGMIYAVAVFEKDGDLCWEKSLSIEYPGRGEEYRKTLRCADASLLEEAYPLTVAELREKYGDFCFIDGCCWPFGYYLLKDGRMVVLEVAEKEQLTLETNTKMKICEIHEPIFYYFEWYIGTVNGRRDYGIPPQYFS